MVIDIVIALFALIALYVGYRRGVLQPLLAELFFVLALLIIVRNRHSYSLLAEHVLHLNLVLAVLAALVIAVVAGILGAGVGGALHRMPVVRGIDGFLGVFVHLGFALVLSYLLVAGLITLDRAFTPTVDAAALTYQQVESIKHQLASNPLTSSLVDSRDIARLETQARAPGGARISEAPQLHQLESLYEDFLRPQLTGSRLAPVVLGIGRHIPFVGRVGPQDLPHIAVPGAIPPAGATPAPTPRRS